MKKFAMLALILISSLTAFSQANTQDPPTDTSAIKLSSKVAREVVKDLLKGDSILAELQAAQSINSVLINNLTLKDSLINRKDTIITLLKAKDANNGQIIKTQASQLETYKQYVKVQDKTIKRQKNLNLLNSVLVPGLIFGLIVAALN